MPAKVGPQLVSEPVVALIERLDPAGRAVVDTWFDRFTMELVPFRHGQQIVALLRRVVASPIYANATADLAWSVLIGLLNDELYESRFLTEDESLAFWQTLFTETPPPASRVQ